MFLQYVLERSRAPFIKIKRTKGLTLLQQVVT